LAPFCFLVILPNMSKTVLGFDVSSSCIGYCVLEIDELSNTITFKKVDFIKPIKTGSIVTRLVETRNLILKVLNEFKPDYIGIEDLIKFMPKSTATTVVILTAFNRMVCLACHDYLKNNSPELFNVNTIRSALKIGTTRPKKPDMPELVAKHLGIIFPYMLGKQGKIKEENYDMADGIAVALYYAFKLTGKLRKKK
jgi:Holliday junction resolvasome RuvABC endonuclease subunit